MERSSSMIQTGFMVCLCLRAQRAVPVHHSSFFLLASGSISEKQVRPGRDVDFDGAAVLLDEALGDA
jgi:hypothetical protein